MDTAIISCTLANPTLPQPPGHPALVYAGQAATLTLTLTNGTGADIGLSVAGSTVELFLPTFFSADAVQAMHASLAGWTPAYNAADQSIVLTFAAGAPTWSAGQALAITIGNAVAAAVPTGTDPPTQALQCDFTGMTGKFPLQVEAPLSVNRAPQPGNASLQDVLQVFPDDQGIICVSQPYDPLTNTISLTFKNTGSTALFTGARPWATQPAITVSFIYGRTAGALAPDDDRTQPALGSAWNIEASVASGEGNAWTVSNPRPDGSRYPVWALQPDPTSPGILGPGTGSGGAGGDQGDVTVAFENVVSLTPMGHTQMIVQCTGFPKDDATAYDDHTFVLDIDKHGTRPGRGASNFGSNSTWAIFTDPAVPAEIPLTWSMADVASVEISSNLGTVPMKTIVYNSDPSQPLSPSATGAQTIRVPYEDGFFGSGSTTDAVIVFTLTAFAGAKPGAEPTPLNRVQFTIGVIVAAYQDASDRKSYPVVLANGLYWMTVNLDHDAGADSIFFNHEQQNEVPYGRLYDATAARTALPPWRLPTIAEVQGLMGVPVTPPDPGSPAPGNLGSAAGLLPGGATGFNAQFGGGMLSGIWLFTGHVGTYWVNDPVFVCVYIDHHGSAFAAHPVDPFGGGGMRDAVSDSGGEMSAAEEESDCWFSVRYVREAESLAAATNLLRAG